MRTKSRQSGVTLTEVTVVVATIALLVAFGLPAIRALLHSFESQSGAKSVISAALAGARAIAAKEQHYAGIRFQRDAAGNQYMVFIVHDVGKTGLSSGFRAVDGLKPIKLPEIVGVMDLMVRMNHNFGSNAAEDNSAEPIRIEYLDDANPLNLEPFYNKNKYIPDTCSFSIIFSPSGRLVVREVRVRNRDGVYQADNAVAGKVSMDDIFNSPFNIRDHRAGMFIDDNWPELGFGAELSRDRFVIFDRTRFDELGAQGRFDYINSLDIIYVNRYTGTMISPD
jgi:hypothetical protein